MTTALGEVSTQSGPPRDRRARTIVELLELSAAAGPDRVAIVDGEISCTYGELDRRARAVAAGLADLGVRQGDRVALWMPNGLDWVESFFGAVYAGAVVVPLNTALSATEIDYQLGHSGAAVLVVCAAYRNRDYLAEALALQETVGQQLTVVCAGGELLETRAVPLSRLTRTEPDASRRPRIDPADSAIMLFTSGTTGRPKGALHSHAFISTVYAAAERLELTEADTTVLYLPLFHILGLVAGLLMMLLSGARVVTMRRFDAEQSLRLIEAERASVVFGIPTTYIDQLNHPAVDDIDFSSVRIAWTTFALDLCRKVQAKLNTVCLNAYGMTETASVVLLPALDDPEQIAMGTVGRTLGEMQARIVDEADGTAQSPGRVGQLVLRGPSITIGYHDQPEATAQAFDEQGWFRTGDLASMDERGNVTFLGRRGDGYRVGGELVDPVEVETAIQSHPEVLRAAVVAVPDERLGEVGYAWVQVRPGAAVSPEELKAHASARLASFKVPRQFRLAAELPTTASGKVQKHILREQLERPGR